MNLNAQSLWNSIDTNALFIENGTMVNGLTRFVDLFNHPIKKNKWWAVSPEAGLFVSSDAANHFTLCKGSNLLPETPLSTVAVDPINDRIIYLGTGDPSNWINGKGLWKSFNGGETFVKLTLPDCIVTSIDISPSNRLILLVATSIGIFRSINGGVTFSQISNTNGIAFTDLKRNLGTNSHVVYATSFSDFFISHNDGANWIVNNSGITFNNNFGYGGRIALSYSDSNLVYLLFAANNGTVFLSNDKGNIFQSMKSDLSPNLLSSFNDSLLSNQGNYALSISCGANSSTIFTGAQNIFLSSDTGHSYTQKTFYKSIIPSGIHEIVYSNNDTIRIATDGGIYTSYNLGNSFTTSTFPSGYFNCYSGNVSNNSQFMISCITPNHGEIIFSNAQFKNIRNPSFSSSCKFSYSKNPTLFYSSIGKSMNLITLQEHQLLPSENHFDDIVFSNTDSTHAYISASAGIYCYSTNDSSANLIYSSNNPIPTLLLYDSILFAFNNLHQLIYCANVNDSSFNYSIRSYPGSSSSIHAVKSSSNELVITCGDSVYISHDDGIHWQQFSSGLPSGIEWKSLEQDPYTPGLLFIAGGTNVVYYRKPGGLQWLPFNASLPTRIPISEMHLFSSSNNDARLFLFYKGIGVLEASFDSLRSLHANFEVSDSNICSGTTIQFKNLSRGANEGLQWYFPGGNPSSSTLINPTVTYDSSGVFDVFLIAKNSFSTDTIIKHNFISTLADSSLPYELFENENSFIDTIINGGEPYYQWRRILTDSSHHYSMTFENYLHNEQGEKDIMQSKHLKIPSNRASQLLFDLAYAPYDSSRNDSLEIQLSTDCGISYKTIYCKSGDQLATAPSQQSYFLPTIAQWRTDTIALSSFAGSDHITFRFNNIGHYGNNIYIDNIRIDTNFIQTTFEFHVNVFIQGLYAGNKRMHPLLYNVGISSDPMACDSINIELTSPTSNFHQSCILNILGEAKINIPTSFANLPTYLKVSHRNSIPIYSREMIIPNKLGWNSYDFTKNR
jgi:PKD repeat protein